MVDQVESTNTALREAATAAPGDWPHLSVLVAEHQTAGRGRAGRSWSTPRGSALTASILLRPAVPPDRLAWLTLLTGLAVVRALDIPRVGLKWPNDLLVTDAGPHRPDWGTARKLGGILTEALPAGPSVSGSAPQPAPADQPAGGHAGATAPQAAAAPAPQAAAATAPRPAPAVQPATRPAGPSATHPAAVVGLGLNLTQQPGELPVPTATSLAAAGLPVPSRDDLLTAVGHELATILSRWEAAGGDAVAAGLLPEVSAVCLTLGRAVRVDLPGADPLGGTATAIDDAGRLVVTGPGSRHHAVVAGDVWHVRFNDQGEPGAADANLAE